MTEDIVGVRAQDKVAGPGRSASACKARGRRTRSSQCGCCRTVSNSDNSMTVYDRRKGYVVALTGAEYHEDRDEWSAVGATVTYLDSNGLHVDTGRSDDPRNRGSHRGSPSEASALMRS